MNGQGDLAGKALAALAEMRAERDALKAERDELTKENDQSFTLIQKLIRVGNEDDEKIEALQAEVDRLNERLGDAERVIEAGRWFAWSGGSPRMAALYDSVNAYADKYMKVAK